MKFDVTVIVVTYNSAPYIERCLSSIITERQRITQNIVVVDNASIDNTANLIQDRFPQVNLILQSENTGFAAGVNRGAIFANSDFILLLNPDTQVLNHSIDRIVEFARTHPENGVYGGRTLTNEGNLEPSSCWDQPTLWSTFLFAFGVSTILSGNRWLDPESIGDWNRESIREVGMITGCFLLCTSSIWNRLNGLNERYFMYGEDVDFSLRARALGCRPIICPDAILIHNVGKSSATSVEKSLLLYQGKSSLIIEHWAGYKRFLGLKLLLIGIGLRALIESVGFQLSQNPKDPRWKKLWNRRSNWICGYYSKDQSLLDQ
jgi:hypothetical protein